MTAVRKSHSDAAIADLFTGDGHRIDNDGAPHRRDFASRSGAARIAPKLTGLRLLCLKELYLAGSIGTDGWKVAEKHGQIFDSIKPRFPELCRMGLAERVEDRSAVNMRGNSILTYRITREGQEIARQSILKNS